jgi:hypothetical protein
VRSCSTRGVWGARARATYVWRVAGLIRHGLALDTESAHLKVVLARARAAFGAQRRLVACPPRALSKRATTSIAHTVPPGTYHVLVPACVLLRTLDLWRNAITSHHAVGTVRTRTLPVQRFSSHPPGSVHVNSHADTGCASGADMHTRHPIVTCARAHTCQRHARTHARTLVEAAISMGTFLTYISMLLLPNKKSSLTVIYATHTHARAGDDAINNTLPLTDARMTSMPVSHESASSSRLNLINRFSGVP